MHAHSSPLPPHPSTVQYSIPCKYNARPSKLNTFIRDNNNNNNERVQNFKKSLKLPNLTTFSLLHLSVKGMRVNNYSIYRYTCAVT